tara:strand:+ start:89 stop:496 length:408 start_codon:yes stop_codon:yes gene_type:complete
MKGINMNKYILFIIVSFASMSFLIGEDIYEEYWEVTPVLSIRHDNLDSGLSVSDAIGVQMEIGENTFTGFDTDGNDYRIYLGWGLGKIGFGHDGTSNAEYTIGTSYEILDNISMDIDYVFGQNEENLRLAIQIHF